MVTVKLTEKTKMTLVIILWPAVMYAIFSWLLFHTKLGWFLPDEVKLWGPVVLYVLFAWFLWTHRTDGGTRISFKIGVGGR